MADASDVVLETASAEETKGADGAAGEDPFVDAGIPFIALQDDSETKFVVHEAAKRVLRACKGKICVIAIAGLYRTGKSFLVNRIVGQQSGFVVGPTVEACTKGIWMWGRPIETTLRDGSKASVIVLDTEGIGGTNATTQHDARVFSLATLLCSHLIYNSLGSISEDAISNLSFIANLTKHIHVSSQSGGAVSTTEEGGEGIPEDDADPGAEFSAFFPSFWWVVRDFALDLRDEHGEEITSRQYLVSSLRDMPG
jgi:hypothetical protein